MWIHLLKGASVLSLFVLALFVSRWTNSDLCLNSSLVGNIYINQGKTQKIDSCEPAYYISFGKAPKWPKSLKAMVRSLEDIQILQGKGFKSLEPLDLWIDYDRPNAYEVFPKVILISKDLLQPEILRKSFIRAWILQQNKSKSLSLFDLNLRVDALYKLIYGGELKFSFYESLYSHQDICASIDIYPEFANLCSSNEELTQWLVRDYRHWAFLDVYSDYIAEVFKAIPLDEKYELLQSLATKPSFDLDEFKMKNTDFSNSQAVLARLLDNIRLIDKEFGFHSQAVLKVYSTQLSEQIKMPILLVCGQPNIDNVMQIDTKKVLVIQNCNTSMSIAWNSLLDKKINQFIRENPLMKYYLFHNPSLKMAYERFAFKNKLSLDKVLGWEALRWNPELQAFEPQALVDGVISFRK